MHAVGWLYSSLRLCVGCRSSSRTGKVAAGAAAVPASRQLDEEDVKRTETLTDVPARSATTKPAFPVTHTHTHTHTQLSDFAVQVHDIST